MPNLTITYKDNIISPETFTDRFEEFLMSKDRLGKHLSIRVAILEFLNSYEV